MVEYYLKRLTPGLVAVSKFEGGEQPSDVYLVREDGKGDMHCDCPNKLSGRGKNDKHGRWVRYWIEKDEPQGFFDKQGVFHANDLATARADDAARYYDEQHGYSKPEDFDSPAGDPGADDDEGHEADEKV